MKCPRCNGVMIVKNKKGIPIKHVSVSLCDFCHGKQDLDWVEFITGVEIPEFEFWHPPMGHIKKGKTWNYQQIKK